MLDDLVEFTEQMPTNGQEVPSKEAIDTMAEQVRSLMSVLVTEMAADKKEVASENWWDEVRSAEPLDDQLVKLRRCLQVEDVNKQTGEDINNQMIEDNIDNKKELTRHKREEVNNDPQELQQLVPPSKAYDGGLFMVNNESTYPHHESAGILDTCLKIALPAYQRGMTSALGSSPSSSSSLASGEHPLQVLGNCLSIALPACQRAIDEGAKQPSSTAGKGDVADLPNGWQAFWSVKYKRFYYHNGDAGCQLGRDQCTTNQCSELFLWAVFCLKWV